jgi:hypothetical protein
MGRKRGQEAIAKAREIDSAGKFQEQAACRVTGLT